MVEKIREVPDLSEMLAPARLVEAFKSFELVLSPSTSRPAKHFHDVAEIEIAFEALIAPLTALKEQGGVINPWAIAGLKSHEVRNSAALAGLWLADFGGNSSERFLAAYLTRAIDTVLWSDELAQGYRVETEVDPAGNGIDRVDLVIQTKNYLIGIEIKIGAGLGCEQLERYSASLTNRAQLLGLKPVVLLLAPFKPHLQGVLATGWVDVANAAAEVAGHNHKQRSFAQQLIASFGEHVSQF